MKRTWLWILAGLVIVCALGVRWRTATVRLEPAPAAEAAAAPEEVASPAPSKLARAPEPDARPEPAPALPDLSSDPVLEDRARQHELASEADARWHQAVDGAGYSASDLDPSVRELFRRVDLEPRYAEGGRIEGLLITGLAPDHPLASLGFRPGDRIDRIQGVALRDPAEIPSLLARLGPHFALCVVRQGQELCREVALE